MRNDDAVQEIKGGREEAGGRGGGPAAYVPSSQLFFELPCRLLEKCRVPYKRRALLDADAAARHLRRNFSVST